MEDKRRCPGAAWVLSLLFSLTMMLCLLLTAAEVLLYRTPGWFEKEYDKYMVLEDVRGEMSMESALQVTEEMMDYLRGDRKNLIVMTNLDGERKEFFSDREKAHLKDCRELFLGGLRLRTITFFISMGILAVLWFGRKQNPNRLPKFIKLVPKITGALLAVAGLTALIVSGNFDRYFVVFHHLFFDNDLWILDPAKDNLINLLPEGFFSDTALRIGEIFLLMELAMCAIFIWIGRKRRTYK